MFSAGAGVFFPEPEFFFPEPEPEVKNPEFAQHYHICLKNWSCVHAYVTIDRTSNLSFDVRRFSIEKAVEVWVIVYLRQKRI